jgi:Fic family protein
MISGLAPGTAIRRSLLLESHRALMRGDTSEAAYAGRLRDMQNWIGGSDHSPRGALYVPPPPETVDDYLEDLLTFVNRDDLPVLGQAAVAHAQFESIHPFTDGNGRIGRALVNAILRRRGATTRVVGPLASALVAQREHYFSLLDRYRAGEIEPLVEAFAEASAVAAAQSRVTARRLAEIPQSWSDALGPVRRDSATAKLVDALLGHPVLSSEDAADLVDAPRSSVFDAIARLVGAGVLRPLTGRQRGQVWGAGAILDELDDLGTRIAIAVRSPDAAHSGWTAG